MRRGQVVESMRFVSNLVHLDDGPFSMRLPCSAGRREGILETRVLTSLSILVGRRSQAGNSMAMNWRTGHDE